MVSRFVKSGAKGVTTSRSSAGMDSTDRLSSKIMNGIYIIGRKRMRIPFFMPVYVVDDKFLVRRKTCLEQTVSIGSNPYYATRILKERQDRFYLFLRIMGKCPSLYGITVQPVLPCTDKQIALLVFQHGLNIYAFGTVPLLFFRVIKSNVSRCSS